MGVTAEIVAERYKVSREDQDKYALQSQQRYAAAVEKGWISEEIAPMKVRRKVAAEGRRGRTRRTASSTATSATAPTPRSRASRS